MNKTQTIVRGMARAFFACAWADQCEETGHGAMLSGKEIFEIMPRRIDPAAWHAARTLHFDMVRANKGTTLAALFRKTRAIPEAANYLPASDFGHYAAMHAMGHGVGLHDFNIDDACVTVPHVEFGSYSLQRDYFHVPTVDVSVRIDKQTGAPVLFFYQGEGLRRELMSYQHVGQHSAADVHWMRQYTRPCHPLNGEARALVREWETMGGPDNQPDARIVQRLTRGKA